ncbi:MAG: undecaprenyl-diphosphate phosphatase [Alphaproteobacteria bacterium]
MSIGYLVFLALVQGITEFLPVSSSGHLMLLHLIAEDEDQMALLIDIALHAGTLAAVMLYCRAEVAALIRGLGHLLVRRMTPEASLTLTLMVASVPIFALGIVVHGYFSAFRESALVIGLATLGFGLLLGAADHFRPQALRVPDLGLKRAVVIGCAQALALIPGVSRSGIIITAGRALGMTRIEAARLALLTGMPAIAGAGAVGAYELVQMGDVQLAYDVAIAAILSMLAALGAIALMFRWLQKLSFMPYVLYRIALGSALIGWSLMAA